MNIYERVVALCAKRGTTKTALESACGFSQNYINKWEKSSPSVKNLIKVAKHLQVSLDYLVGLTENEGLIPCVPQTAVAVPEEYQPLLADKQYGEITKLYYSIDDVKRSMLFGVILGCLQTLKVDTKEILGY